MSSNALGVDNCASTGVTGLGVEARSGNRSRARTQSVDVATRAMVNRRRVSREIDERGIHPMLVVSSRHHKRPSSSEAPQRCKTCTSKERRSAVSRHLARQTVMRLLSRILFSLRITAARTARPRAGSSGARFRRVGAGRSGAGIGAPQATDRGVGRSPT